jgi:hypothetical protein
MLLVSTMTIPAVAGELITEDFETSFPPEGWSLIHLGDFYQWMWGWNGGHSGVHSAIIRPGYDGAFEDEWLVTPARDTAGGDYLFLEFYESGQDWTAMGGLHEVLVSTTVADDPAAFTPVWSVTPASYDAPWLDSEREEWAQVQINLSVYLGETIYVAFHYVGDDTDHWWVDDVRLNAPVEHDLQAVEIMPMNTTWHEGSEITPRFTVANTGVNTEAFTANMVIERDGAVFYDETITVTALEPEAEIDLDFSPFVCESGDYRLLATAVLPADGYPVDNQMIVENVCYTGQRTPLGILFTNWSCGPCVSANTALDAWYPQQGDDAGLIRVHVWWPGADDPMYQANIEQNHYLLEMCPTDVTGVPTLYMDNQLAVMEDGTLGWPLRVVDAYGQRAVAGSPIEMAITYDHDDTSVNVEVTVLDSMPADFYRLVVAVTEDDIYAPGSNGEEHHNQAFRRLFPDLIGLPVTTTPGTHEYTVQLDLDPEWVLENLRATAWVQADTTGHIVNSATVKILSGTTAVDDHDQVQPAVVGLFGARPNPFNPRTSISYSIPQDGQVRLQIVDLRGRLIITLVDEVMATGYHEVTWNGRDSTGREIPSGIYFSRLEVGGQVAHGRMTLVR